jgi:hypothetical protein
VSQSDEDEVKSLALLIVNLGKKKRNENLFKIAEHCVKLKERYNSWTKLAKMIKISDERPHISAEMLREFGAIYTLSDEVKQMIKDGLITSVDIAYRLSLLKNKDDQTNLAKIAVAKKLSTSDIRAIVEYKLKNENVTIDEATQRVLESKAKVVTRHIVIMELSNETLEKLKKRANESKQSVDRLVYEMLSKKWNKDWLLSFGMKDSDIIIKLSEEGFGVLQQEAKKLKIELKDLANIIISKEL